MESTPDNTIENIAARLLRQAREEQVVMQQPYGDGLQLLAYPLADGALVALGFARDSAHRVQPDSVLRRRALQPARYAGWLPAMLGDGSWYVVRRLRLDAGGQPCLPDSAAWQAARELLA
ncbi:MULTISPECIES: hypothetical protein [Massilia]|uniref:Aminoglycoside phosphotransferase n=1 Tax=Massilia mucilaginosa TaxID=2609282 RepID=A0ABX0NW73_9BURK|nr:MULTISPECIES: hypothetical protein [Massilia]NHZ91163.1 hypothetical protein [Massilia mucilaginosa]NHZ94525.1 hypothetical protein [Massilia sp. CCM 8734]